MSSKTASNLTTIVDKFTPEILGVVWITKNELSRELLGFDEFNYLFDGLISQYLYGQKETSSKTDHHKSNIFFTKNFNQNIFLLHLEMQAEVAIVLNQQVQLIEKNKSDERTKILLLDQSEKNLGSELQRTHPLLQFIELNLN